MRKFLIKVSGEQYEVEVEEVKNGKATATSVINPAPATAKAATAPTANVAKGDIFRIDSPMPGNVLKIVVKIGDVLKKGQTAFFLEAMKMENEISSPKDGKVIDIQAKVGDTVDVGQPIIILE